MTADGQDSPRKTNIPQPIRSDGAGGLDKGPRDIMRDLENPDMFVPPVTDAGLVPNLKFSSPMHICSLIMVAGRER